MRWAKASLGRLASMTLNSFTAQRNWGPTRSSASTRNGHDSKALFRLLVMQRGSTPSTLRSRSSAWLK
eukprot:7702177-Alexandrium_andersonii.AAC.1